MYNIINLSNKMLAITIKKKKKVPQTLNRAIPAERTIIIVYFYSVILYYTKTGQSVLFRNRDFVVSVQNGTWCTFLGKIHITCVPSIPRYN